MKYFIKKNFILNLNTQKTLLKINLKVHSSFKYIQPTHHISMVTLKITRQQPRLSRSR